MNRKGMALLIALVGLLLVTALATAALTAARLRMQSGWRELAATRALEGARGSVDRRAAEWDTVWSVGAPIGSMVGQPSSAAAGGLVVRDSLIRLGETLFLVRSSAEAQALGGSILARDGVSRVVQVIPLMDSASRAALGPWVLRNSRDNVAMVGGVIFVTNGWARWP